MDIPDGTIMSAFEVIQTSDDQEIIEILGSSNRDGQDGGNQGDHSNNSNDVELESSMLQLLRTKAKSVEEICSEFIQLCVSDPEAGLFKFMQFVLETSDIDTPEMQNNQVKSGIFFNAASSQENVHRFPVMVRSSHTFSVDVSSFLEQLLHAVICTSVVLQSQFMRKMGNFLIVGTESDVVPLRHTNTLIALKMMTALNNMIALQNESQRRLWANLLKKVFLKRRLDVAADIRSMCVAECGVWLDNFPQGYISNKRLIHLFEALDDGSMKVEEASLDAIVKLEKKTKLREQIVQEGYKSRMALLSISLSTPHTKLVDKAIHLLVAFQRVMPEVIDNEMVQIIEQMAFTANRNVAQAAAQLLHARFMAQPTASARVLAMARLFVKFFRHEQTPYLIDAFYGIGDSLLDWSTMVKILLDQEDLTHQEATVIIEIMALSVRQAVTGDSPSGRITDPLAKVGANELVITSIFPSLNMLLHKYRMDPLQMKYLLDLPLHMSFSSEQVELLLGQIKTLVLKHNNVEVMHYCTAALHLLSQKYEKVAAPILKELMERAALIYLETDSAWQLSVSKKQVSRINACNQRLLVALRIISAVYQYCDMSEFPVMNSVLLKLKQAVKDRDPSVGTLSDETISICIEICYVGISWNLKRIQEAARVGDQIDGDCLVVAEHQDIFFLAAMYIIKNSNDVNFSGDAFASACELLVLFAENMRHSKNPALCALEYRPSAYELKILENFAIQYVFGGTAAAELDNAVVSKLAGLVPQKRRVLSGFCKLCISNVVPVLSAANVLQYYEQFFSYYGDILFSTLEHCMLINTVDLSMVLMHSLLLLYRRIMGAFDSPVQASDSLQFGKLISMSKMFSHLFSFDPVKTHPAVLILHRAGIVYATEGTEDAWNAPENLFYLKVVRQFVYLLQADDITDILGLLDSSLIGKQPNTSPEWEALHYYRDSLVAAHNQNRR
ncbi:hypothetical protein AWZ03_012523 [Drosophila navojoa]|uniref:SCD domain-containing protein n=1 Tax=Drosophila navojoa TaxID=7232 RepID=A0A484AX42_DRONA|nr:cohesin subunit SA-2-like [Drosophila navojoa]TDG41056.1 hypothetical protein AWZ03_012523 [Drosophila navojoa]